MFYGFDEFEMFVMKVSCIRTPVLFLFWVTF